MAKKHIATNVHVCEHSARSLAEYSALSAGPNGKVQKSLSNLANLCISDCLKVVDSEASVAPTVGKLVDVWKRYRKAMKLQEHPADEYGLKRCQIRLTTQNHDGLSALSEMTRGSVSVNELANLCVEDVLEAVRTEKRVVVRAAIVKQMWQRHGMSSLDPPCASRSSRITTESRVYH